MNNPGSNKDRGTAELHLGRPLHSLSHNFNFATMTKALFTLLAVLSAAVTASAAGALELTPDNFEDSIKGKNGFVKFLAPWYVTSLS
jgi:hypothetical protein